MAEAWIKDIFDARRKEKDRLKIIEKKSRACSDTFSIRLGKLYEHQITQSIVAMGTCRTVPELVFDHGLTLIICFGALTLFTCAVIVANFILSVITAQMIPDPGSKIAELLLKVGHLRSGSTI